MLRNAQLIHGLGEDGPKTSFFGFATRHPPIGGFRFLEIPRELWATVLRPHRHNVRFGGVAADIHRLVSARGTWDRIMHDLVLFVFKLSSSRLFLLSHVIPSHHNVFLVSDFILTKRGNFV